MACREAGWAGKGRGGGRAAAIPIRSTPYCLQCFSVHYIEGELDFFLVAAPSVHILDINLKSS